MSSLTGTELKNFHNADWKEFEKQRGSFEEWCKKLWPLWQRRIREVQALEAERGAPVRSTDEIGKVFAQNAKQDLKDLQAEVNSMVTRTSPIVAATTLLYAVFALRPNDGKAALVVTGNWLLVAALLLNAFALVFTIIPLAAPLRKAWKSPYDKRRHHTLLFYDDFTSWVHNCWLGERRTPVIQKYKKFHSLGVYLLITASVIAIPGIGLSIIFR